jgi:hypothetical protein
MRVLETGTLAYFTNLEVPKFLCAQNLEAYEKVGVDSCISSIDFGFGLGAERSASERFEGR